MMDNTGTAAASGFYGFFGRLGQGARRFAETAGENDGERTIETGADAGEGIKQFSQFLSFDQVGLNFAFGEYGGGGFVFENFILQKEGDVATDFFRAENGDFGSPLEIGNFYGGGTAPDDIDGLPWGTLLDDFLAGFVAEPFGSG